MSQLLARDLGTRDQQLMSELLNMMKEERQRQDKEATQKVELRRQQQLEWWVKPCMSDYCGLREDEEVYLIHEIKNQDERCEDHRSSELRTCSTCRHRVSADGETKDEQMIARLGERSRNAASLQQGGGDQGLQQYLARIGAMKSFEAAQAFYAGKMTFRPPNYLPYCGLASRAPDFVPCVVKNPHDRCDDWNREPGTERRLPDDKPDDIATSLDDLFER